jgi:predicted secreted protein
MPFQTPLAIAIYLTMWWIVLFTTLPFGVRSLHEDEMGDAPEGSDPGAPIAPALWKKALATTVVTTILFGVLVLVVNYMG